jgi:hypothetical protein
MNTMFIVFWLGEAFMRQDDPGVALQEIFKGIRI